MNPFSQADSPFFERNRLVVERRWPRLWSLIAHSPPTPWEQDGEGAPMLGGLHLTSRHDRMAEARIQAEAIPPESREAWVYGLGLGDLPRALLERPQLHHLHGVIFHPGAFLLLLQLQENSAWLEDPRTQLQLADDKEPVMRPFAASPGCLHLPGGWPKGEKLRARVGLELATPFINRDHAGNPAMKRQLMENRRFLEQDGDSSTLFGSRKGATLMVVGSGPSLMRQYGWMRRHRQEYPMVAAASALMPLQKAGLVPDVVVTTDPFPIIRTQLDIDLAPFAGVPLVYFPTSAPEVLELWPGPRLAAYSPSPIYRELAAALPRAELFSAGSVIHTAVDLAMKMGASRILLVGTDFAFPAGVAHATGFSEIITLGIATTTLTVPNGRGEKVPTLPSFNHFRLDLEAAIARRPTVRFVNTSREGARIEGALYPEEAGLADLLREEEPPALPFFSPVEADTPFTLARELCRNAEMDVTHCRLPHAWDAFHAALEQFKILDHPGGQAQAMAGIGEMLVRRGQLKEAGETLFEALRLAQESRDLPLEAEVRRAMAEWHMARGEMVDAASHLDRAQAILHALDAPFREARLKRTIATFQLNHGRWEDAHQALGEAIHLYGETGSPMELGWCLLETGLLLARQNLLDEARQALGHAWDTFTQCAAPLAAALTRNHLFLLDLEQGVRSTEDRSDCPALLKGAVRAFRQGMDAQGNESLGLLIDCLLKAIRAGTLQISPEETTPMLKEMLLVQSRGDTLRLADMLEFEIARAFFHATAMTP